MYYFLHLTHVLLGVGSIRRKHYGQHIYSWHLVFAIATRENVAYLVSSHLLFCTFHLLSGPLPLALLCSISCLCVMLTGCLSTPSSHSPTPPYVSLISPKCPIVQNHLFLLYLYFPNRTAISWKRANPREEWEILYLLEVACVCGWGWLSQSGNETWAVQSQTPCKPMCGVWPGRKAPCLKAKEIQA